MRVKKKRITKSKKEVMLKKILDALTAIGDFDLANVRQIDDSTIKQIAKRIKISATFIRDALVNWTPPAILNAK